VRVVGCSGESRLGCACGWKVAGIDIGCAGQRVTTVTRGSYNFVGSACYNYKSGKEMIPKDEGVQGEEMVGMYIRKSEAPGTFWCQVL